MNLAKKQIGNSTRYRVQHKKDKRPHTTITIKIIEIKVKAGRARGLKYYCKAQIRNQLLKERRQVLTTLCDYNKY